MIEVWSVHGAKIQNSLITSRRIRNDYIQIQNNIFKRKKYFSDKKITKQLKNIKILIHIFKINHSRLCAWCKKIRVCSQALGSFTIEKINLLRNNARNRSVNNDIVA